MSRPVSRPPSAPPLTAVPQAAAPSRPLHVVEVLGAVPPEDSGAARLVERLIERLADNAGFRFTVLCPVDGPYTERLRALGAETIVVPMPDDPAWHAIQVLVGLVRNRQADVLHAHLPNAHRLAGLAGSITRTPVLATVQGVQLDMPDLEVHRLIASQLSVVTEASYFHALGLGIAPERIGCEPVDADASDEAVAASLDGIGQRLRLMAAPPPSTPVDSDTSKGSRGLAQARALVQPLTSASAPATVAAALPAPVAIRAVLDDLTPQASGLPDEARRAAPTREI